VFVSWIGGGGAMPTNGVGGPLPQVHNQRCSSPSPREAVREAVGRVRVGGRAAAKAIVVSRASMQRMRIRPAKFARHHNRPPPSPSPPLLRRGGRGTQASARILNALANFADAPVLHRYGKREAISAARPPPPAKRWGGYGWGAEPPRKRLSLAAPRCNECASDRRSSRVTTTAPHPHPARRSFVAGGGGHKRRPVLQTRQCRR
jgi:hypothetical protein